MSRVVPSAEPAPADPTAVCPLCGNSARRLIPYPAPEQAARQLRLREIAICQGCGLGAVVPLPDQAVLDRFYDSGAYWQGTGDNLLQQAHERAQSELRVRYCLARRTAQTPISVLDVGAGHGWTADWLARYLPGNVARFDFVEPDERNAARILRKSVPFPVARIPSLAATAGRYDLVFLNHVLEHMADPIAATVQVASRLTATGFAYVETPHSDYRFKDDVFPHTYFFTVPAFAKLAQRAGVEQLGCESFGRWLPARGTPGFWPGKVWQKLFSYAARGAPWPLQRWLDHSIWNYGEGGDGIWLRWVFRCRAAA